VQLGPKYKELHAEAALGAERDRLWSAVTAQYPVYKRYAEGTKRVITVVVLRANVAAEPTTGQPQTDGMSKVDDAPAEVEIARATVATEEALHP
jgi:hypothetical protein